MTKPKSFKAGKLENKTASSTNYGGETTRLHVQAIRTQFITLKKTQLQMYQRPTHKTRYTNLIEEKAKDCFDS